MRAFENIERVYFIGIGGIGMSAIARYFKASGLEVMGYDRTSTPLTDQLAREGIAVHFRDDPALIPNAFENSESSLIIYTPAIPADHLEKNYFINKGYKLWKRSEVLGLIIEGKKGIAVAGTHGKTTISAMLANIFNSSERKCNAFLGGISKNLNSNLLLNADSDLMVVEADEFDRSFLFLLPEIAIVSSVDADHLDIYGNIENLKQSFEKFLSQVQKGGKVIINQKVKLNIAEGIEAYSYSLDDSKSDFYAEQIIQEGYLYRFDFVHPEGKIEGFKTGVPGIVNLENAIAALAASWLCDISPESLKSGVSEYKGVNRRFDIQYSNEDKLYIDDYAHHPEELRAFILSVKKITNSKITGIFQPHLFSRTKDFAEGFAESLSLLDNVILLDIYPAREKPLPGISSGIIFDRLTNKGEKILCKKDQLLKVIEELKPKVLLSMGAGDIDQLVDELKLKMQE